MSDAASTPPPAETSKLPTAKGTLSISAKGGFKSAFVIDGATLNFNGSLVSQAAADLTDNGAILTYNDVNELLGTYTFNTAASTIGPNDVSWTLERVNASFTITGGTLSPSQSSKFTISDGQGYWQVSSEAE